MSDADYDLKIEVLEKSNESLRGHIDSIYDALAKALGAWENESHQNGADAVGTLAAQRDHALRLLESEHRFPCQRNGCEICAALQAAEVRR